MANALSALLKLLPGNPLLVGTVASVSGNELRIQLDDGSIATARGAYSVGQRVSFRPGGTVEGLAPALPLVDIPI